VTDVLALHKQLVEIPSLSHQEGLIADFVEAFLKEAGAKTRRINNNVIAWRGEGRKLLFNSHLDTVPPNSAWTRNPHQVIVEDGKIYGLGSNDAKASVAAMTTAFLNHDGPGELCLMLVQEEETGGKGTERAFPWLLDQGWRPDGVVVGEPTELNIGIAQKGLMILELIATGDACHAANANRLGAKNPIFELAKAITKLEDIDLSCHDELGPTTLQPTQLKGAEIHNQVPGQAVAVLDIRTVPGLSHAQIVQQIKEATRLEIKERSTRLEPYAVDPNSDVVRAALAAGGGKSFASPTMSDQVFFRGWPAIKCGPGVSARSHSADEYVLESELLEGASFYGRLIHEFAIMG
jgi:acetylornithine deacetylase